MYKHYLLITFWTICFALPKVEAQECFFVRNVLDTLYQIDPATGTLGSYAMTPDFPGQPFFGYLSTIDPVGRRHMFVTLLSDTSYDDFGLKVIQLDNQSVSNVLLTDYELASPGTGQFSFHGLEYGSIADAVYMARVEGDSLYKIDMATGKVSAVMEVPYFGNTYSYLQTFHQSEQRYAMIAVDDLFQRRFIQVDIDDDTVYVSPPMTFVEPLRGLEVSELTGEYFVMSDADQTFYKIDPLTGTLTPQMVVPGYQNAFGYLHTFDYSTNKYMIVGVDNSQNISLFSVLPSSGTSSYVPFPVPIAGYFGLEATNTQFIAKMIKDLEEPEPPIFISDVLPALPFSVFPDPITDWLHFSWESKEPAVLTLLDHNGEPLMSKELYPETSMRIAVNEFPDGRYFLHVRTPSKGQAWGGWIKFE